MQAGAISHLPYGFFPDFARLVGPFQCRAVRFRIGLMVFARFLPTGWERPNAGRCDLALALLFLAMFSNAGWNCSNAGRGDFAASFFKGCVFIDLIVIQY